MANILDNRNYGVYRRADKSCRATVFYRFFLMLYSVAYVYLRFKHFAACAIRKSACAKHAVRRIYPIRYKITFRRNRRKYMLRILQGCRPKRFGKHIAGGLQACNYGTVPAVDKRNCADSPFVRIIFKLCLSALVSLFIVFFFSLLVHGVQAPPEDLQQATEYLQSVSQNDTVTQTLKNAIAEAFPNVIKSFFTLACALLLSSVASAVKKAVSADPSPDACDFASGIVCGIIVFQMIRGAFSAASIAVNSACTFMASLLGIMCMIYGYSGNVVSGGVFVSVLTAVLNGVQVLFASILFPIILSLFGMTLANSLRYTESLGAFASFVKKTVTFLLSLCGVIVTFLLTVQTALGSAGQTLTRKTLKFASGAFIPFIGSSLAEALDTVYSSISVIKTASGIAGMVAIATLLIPPIISIVLTRLMCTAAAFVANMLGLPMQSGLLKGCEDILSLMLACVCFSGAVFIIGCALFMKAGAA